MVKIVFGVNALTRRPLGAKDCGIYPTHHPLPSTTSGMPSGHAQTACFLTTLVLSHRRSVPGAHSFGPKGYAGDVLLIVYCAAILLSRTKHGGKLSVCVDGVVPGCHTVLQVAVGAAVGTAAGLAAYPRLF